MEKLLNKLYYDIKIGYCSINKLYVKAKSEFPKLQLKDVKAWLEKQPTYTLHKPARRKYGRNRVLVSGIDEQWQADLVDLQSLSKFNDGYKFLLTCIDIFSKFSWAIPIKSKNSKDVLFAFQKILESNRQPQKLQTDAGTEFTNKDFQKFLKSEYINFFTTNSEMKASVVERFNRTLKERMWRYFTKQNTYKYIDVLSELMHNYNNSFHRTIGMPPVNVSHKNERDILNKVFRINPNQHTEFKFEIDDKVRISKVKRTFEKGYIPNWTEEYFIISNRYARNPPVYTIKDQLGEVIEGVFYEYELQKISSSANDLNIIQQVLKKRKKGGKVEYLVRWRGYGPRFDSWISDFIQL